MSGVTFGPARPSSRCGLKGPGAAKWLAAHGVELPAAPNCWVQSATAVRPECKLLVARLGASEFFLEGELDVDEQSSVVMGLGFTPAGNAVAPGVYPVLREDAAFELRGDGACAVLAEVCSIDFANLSLATRPLLMTLMVGVAVLIIPRAIDSSRCYRIWCDPTYGDYLGDTLRKIVIECGGILTGESA